MRMTALLGTAYLICAGTPAYAEAYQYYPNSPLHLGSTFDPRFMADAKLPCIKFQNRLQLSAYDSNKPLSMETQYTIDQLTTRRQLYEYLHVSASVSGHYKFFSGGASYDLEQENTFDSDGFSWVMRGYTKYGEFGLVDPQLSAEAQKWADAKNVDALRKRCGTEFIGQESRSVLIAAVYSVKNLSQSNYRKVKASFDAAVGGGVWGVEGKTKYESFFKEASSLGSLSFRLYIIGGEGISKIFDIGLATNDIDQVKWIIARYTANLTVDYSIPTDFMSGSLAAFFPELATYDFGRYNRFIGEAYLASGDLIAKRNRLLTILANADDWGLTDTELSALQTQSDLIANNIAAIEDKARKCRSLHEGPLSVLQSKKTDIESTCALEAKLVVTKITWPSDRPYRLNYWVDNLTTAPQVWMYVDVKGPKIAIAQVVGADGRIIAVLNVVSDGFTKKALGAVEYSKLSEPQKPLSLKVTTESGAEYTSALPYNSSAPVSGVVAANNAPPVPGDPSAMPAGNTRLLIRNGTQLPDVQPSERRGEVVIAPQSSFR